MVRRTRQILLWALIALLSACAAGVICICVFCGTAGSFFLAGTPQGALPGASDASERTETERLTSRPDPMTDAEVDALPHDKLFITGERQFYENGDLTLVVPRLDLTVEVWNGTSLRVLDNAVGLYDYAQLPGTGNRNVSIAGHRDRWVNGRSTDDAPFYYIDTLTYGDYLYLYDDTSIYQYEYKDTKIVEANDWGPVYSQGFSCLTLTSCHPIGVSTQRIVVRAELNEVLPYDDSFTFPAS